MIIEGAGYKVQHAPGELGLLPLPQAPLRVRRVGLLDRNSSQTRARLVPLPASEALVLLAPHSSALASMPAALRTMVGVLTRTGGALRAQYSGAGAPSCLLHPPSRGARNVRCPHRQHRCCPRCHVAEHLMSAFPTEVLGITNVKQASAGHFVTYVEKNDETVRSAGTSTSHSDAPVEKAAHSHRPPDSPA